jgi:multidrug resistance protein
VVAVLAPSIVGDLADQSGRRPVTLLAFILYLGANLGLALQNSYGALQALRCLQSAAASGTVAIAYGVIADIAPPAERGSYVGLFLGLANAAPSLGPVLGGLLAQKLSWRWIFWFLSICSGTHLLGVLVFLPETSRKDVGNRRKPQHPPSLLPPPIYILLYPPFPPPSNPSPR